MTPSPSNLVRLVYTEEVDPIIERIYCGLCETVVFDHWVDRDFGIDSTLLGLRAHFMIQHNIEVRTRVTEI